MSDQGVSQPYQCYDESGVLRWCKGNHTGLRSLMSEWVCARIARELGLPVPACDILRLDPALFQDWVRCQDVRVPQLVTEANPVVTEGFLDEVWSEMPTEWTEVGSETLSLVTVKDVLLGEAF